MSAETAIRDLLAADPAIQAALRSVRLAEQNRNEAAAVADPLAHKLCRIFPYGVSNRYRYYSSRRDGRNREVRFCWSVNRNAAGFYLGWRELVSKAQVKRDRWTARRKRCAVKKIAAKRSQAADKPRVKAVPVAMPEAQP
jgi:hypothetical protein